MPTNTWLVFFGIIGFTHFFWRWFPIPDLTGILNSIPPVPFSEMSEIQHSYPDTLSTERLKLSKTFTGDISVTYTIYLETSSLNAIGEVIMFSDGEIWYKIFPPFRNNGYVTEAVSTIIKASLATDFYLRIKSSNLASGKVAEKLGFKLVSTDNNILKYIYTKPQ